MSLKRSGSVSGTCPVGRLSFMQAVYVLFALYTTARVHLGVYETMGALKKTPRIVDSPYKKDPNTGNPHDIVNPHLEISQV